MSGPIVIPEDWNHADRMAAHFADRAIWYALQQLRAGRTDHARHYLNEVRAQMDPARPFWARPREAV